MGVVAGIVALLVRQEEILEKVVGDNLQHLPLMASRRLKFYGNWILPLMVWFGWPVEGVQILPD